MVSDVYTCYVVDVVAGSGPLALDGPEWEIVPRHEFTDTGTEKQGWARHAEVGVEVHGSHALCLAFEKRAVVRVYQNRDEIGKHVFETARVDLVARDAAHDGCVVELAPCCRGRRLRTVRRQRSAEHLEAAGRVRQDREHGRVVREERVHEAVGDGDGQDQEETNVVVLHFA